MRQEIITCEQGVTAGNVRIVPVVKTSLLSLDIRGSLTFHAFKQPEYVVIERDGDRTVCRMTGEIITIDQAMTECPALEAALARQDGFRLPAGL